jgi:1,4-dihydroxy-2-naphthoate octaprenyltransferase
MAGNRPLAVIKSCWYSFRSLVRWNEWASSKLPLVFAAFYYAILAQPQLGLAAFGELSGLVWILTLNACFGFAVNSYSDRLIDEAAGKPNALSKMSNRRALGVVSCFPLLALPSALILYHDRYVLILLIGLSFLLAWAYSMPPVRLKEWEVGGLVAASTAQRVLPAMIVFQAVEISNLASISMCVLSGLVGLRYIVVHQILDSDSDLRSGVVTMAVRRGEDFMKTLLTRCFIPAEFLVLSSAIFLMSASAPGIGVMYVAYLFYFALQWYVSDREREKRFSAFSYWFFSDFYNVMLPTFLSICLLVSLGTGLWPVVLFNFLWLNRGIRKELKRFFETFCELATLRRRKSFSER